MSQKILCFLESTWVLLDLSQKIWLKLSKLSTLPGVGGSGCENSPLHYSAGFQKLLKWFEKREMLLTLLKCMISDLGYVLVSVWSGTDCREGKVGNAAGSPNAHESCTLGDKTSDKLSVNFTSYQTMFLKRGRGLIRFEFCWPFPTPGFLKALSFIQLQGSV